MKKEVFLIAAGLLIGWVVPPETVIQQIAREKERGAEALGEISQRVCDSMAPAAEGNDLEEAIAAVLADRGEFQISEITTGMSGHPVFGAYLGELLVHVVKAYRVPARAFVDDFWAQAAAAGLPLSDAAIPAIEGVARVQVAGSDYLLFIQQGSPGMTPWALFRALESEQDEERRQPLREEVRDALYRVGRAMNDYHVQSFTRYEPLSKSVLTTIRTAAERTFQLITAHPEYGFDVAALRALFEGWQQEVEGLPFCWSYVHGDAHYQNYLYDPETKLLTVIDMGCGAQYIDSHFDAEGTPWIDIVKLVEQAALNDPNSTYGYVDAFVAGYGNISFDDPRYRYFLLFYAFQGVNWYFSAKEQLPDWAAFRAEASVFDRLRRASSPS